MATKIKNKTFHTSIDIEEGVRTQMIDLLNQQLADTFDLFSLTKQAHWNVKGPEFMQLHEFYDTLAEGLEDYVDTIAERITALGGFAKGTVRMASAATRLPDLTGHPVSGLGQVKEFTKP